MKMRFTLVAIIGTTLLTASCMNTLHAQSIPKNWQALDPSSDKVLGISLQKAYDYLSSKNKKATPIIVAVLDSGIDTTHEDLKNILNNGCETNSYLNTKYERSESWSFNVYLCSSLNGNTSSSILHDIIFNIKNIVNVKILSYLINTSSLYITENKEKQNHYKKI